MSEPAGIGRFVSAVFAAWQRENIVFLVMRNYGGLPEHTTNDIDVLVSPSQRVAAEQCIVSTALQHGFSLHTRAEFATLALYFHNPDTLEQAHFDLFTELSWRGFRFLECKDFLSRRVEREGFFVPHPCDEATASLLSYTIYSGRVKDKYKENVSYMAGMEARHMQNLLTRSYGSRLASRIVQAAARRDWQAIERLVPSLRRRLVFRHLNRHPLWLSWSLLRNGWRLFARLLRPPGIVVALCGPDGSGKTTVSEQATNLLAPTFGPAKTCHYHWKPPVFSTGRRARRVSGPNPQDQPARGSVASLVYFAFHWTEFFLGSHFAFRRLAFRNGLILIDRFYYDFLVDQKRYRLNVPKWLVEAGMAFLKHPDIAVVLDAPPEVLSQRKQELTLPELARQRNAFLELARHLPNAVVIDASQPADLVASTLARMILTHCIDRRRG